MKQATKRTSMAAIALLGLIGSAYAIDNMPVKEGYWSVHTVTVDQPGNKSFEAKYSICRNHAYDSYVEEMKKIPGCVIKSQSVQGNKHYVEMSCAVAGTTIASKSTVVYNSDTSIHGEESATYTPVFHGMAAEKMTTDFAYVGSCPAGVQPGDRVAQDGTVRHLWKH